MPNAFYAKKKVSIYHFGEVCIRCADQSTATPVLCVPKVFPTTQSIKESNEYTHTLQATQKAPVQHQNFLETTTTTKMSSTEAEKFLKKSLNCLILYSHESLEELQTKPIYIYISPCMLLPVTHTLLGRSAYTQQG